MSTRLHSQNSPPVDCLAWGAHACQFYRSREELVGALVPYFKAGLQGNEACLWITSNTLEAREAEELIVRALPDFGAYIAKGQIDIRDAKDWYTPDGRFDADRVLHAWLERERHALARGYSGLRLAGDTSWIERALWDDFMEYERRIDEVLPRQKLIALCTYCLDNCNADDVAHVARRHEFALVNRDGAWERVDGTRTEVAGRTLAALTLPAPATLGDVLYARKGSPRVPESEWVVLVRAIAAGDQLALHALYERAHRLVFTLTVRITGSRETAEEVTLDVFHDIWRRASRYDPVNGTVLGWIMNQARSRAIDRLRFDQRKKRTDAGVDEACADLATDIAEDFLLLKERAGVLRVALGVLTPDEREVIEAAFFQELTHAEVAAKLQQPLGTVKTRIRSGLHKLRRALALEGKSG